MRNRIILVLWVALSACATTLCGDDRQVDHVVLVSVDGLTASYLNDPHADMPHLRAIADAGVVAEGMRTIFPSVTWPAHTSLITGVKPARHGVIGNAVWNRRKQKRITYIGDAELSKQQAVRVPTLYDTVHAAGYSTASVIWPCSNGAPTLDWMIPDSNQQQMHDRYTTPGLAKELMQAGIDISELGSWGWKKEYSTQRDQIYTDAALFLLQHHRVNLTMLHLVTPDGVEHVYGPNSPPAYDAVAESDQRIGEIWSALQEPPLLGRSTLVVVSDHGFAPYRRIFQPNAMLREMGLIQTNAEDEVTERSAWCVAQGGSAFLYLLDEKRRHELADEILARLASIAPEMKVIHSDEFEDWGLPDPLTNFESPDLVLLAPPDFKFADDVAGPVIVDAGGRKGTHGHDPRPSYMHSTFVAAGAGIKSGVKLGIIESVDVAPTIAYLFGLKMDTDGRVLSEALLLPPAE